MSDTIHYPCYKDFDPFIDVARLRSLDGYIRERLEPRLRASRDLKFYTGPFLLDEAAPTLPGSRMVYLSRSRREDNYYDLDRTELWEPSEEAGEFAELMAFIATLPFKATGRMLIMYDDSGRAVSAHRDHDSADHCHEFVWFRTNFDKPFYMLNPDSGEKCYVRSHAAWFDTVNQYHGADASRGLAFSIRVDGIFSDAFRAQFPSVEPARAAAIPAVWAQQDRLHPRLAGANRDRHFA
ncbi:MAG: hypothetical protein M3177_04125 [Pseudomonadota bacterium]|nr:hypothetical protein [Pseudomonadota bacterium]